MEFLSGWEGVPVLVTGGTGFIGQHVLAYGRRSGLNLHNMTLGESAPAPVQNYQADLTSRAQVFEMLEHIRPRAIVHLAAAGVIQGSASFEDMLRINALGLQSLLEAALHLEHPPQIVISGSCYEYAAQDRPLTEADPVIPSSPYGVSKVAALPIAHFYARRLPITWLRLFQVYGPGEPYPRLIPYVIQCARRGERVELTAGAQVRDFTYVGDVAQSFWRALAVPAAPGSLRIINVATGRGVRLHEFVERLAGILQERGFGPDIVFGAKPYRPDELMMYAADISLMRRLLGWVPQTSLEEGLRRTVEVALEQA